MDKKQLQILREHCELWTLPDFVAFSFKKPEIANDRGPFLREDKLFEGVSLMGGWKLNIENEAYYVDRKLFQVFDKIITRYFLDPKNLDPGILKTAIKNKLRFYSPLKEDQLKLISGKIIEKNEELEMLIIEELTYPCLPKSIQELIENWQIILTENEILKAVEILKFDILKGKRIETLEAEHEWLIETYLFNCQKIPLLRKATSLYTEILYLKGLIEDLESQDDKILLKEGIKENKNAEDWGIKSNIFCKGMPVSFAIDHFKFFTQANRKNGKSFLTSEDFKKFIAIAFYGNKKPVKINFNYEKRELHVIRRKFYDFYTEAVKKYDQRANCRDNYIRLLSDNFIGFSFEKIKANFHKP